MSSLSISVTRDKLDIANFLTHSQVTRSEACSEVDSSYQGNKEKKPISIYLYFIQTYAIT